MAEIRPSLTPVVCYRDPRAALAWLEKAFGFELHMLVEDGRGNIMHSEMRFGDSLIMVAGEWTPEHKSPKSIGGVTTQSVHVQLIDGLDVHCERARAAGAVIVQEPTTQPYGDRTYHCRDPEGHFWTVGQAVRVMSREDHEASGAKIAAWPA